MWNQRAILAVCNHVTKQFVNPREFMMTFFRSKLLHTSVVVLMLAATTQANAGETINNVGITMVDIPAGSFKMGACKESRSAAEENKKRAFLGQSQAKLNCGKTDPEAEDHETPQHLVRVGKFQMGKTEVTLGQFKKFIADSGNTQLLSDDFIKYNAFGDNAPVVFVSWSDAKLFINWLNNVAGGGYRLPSESEWEYACRAGANHTYCGSNKVEDVAWYGKNSDHRQHTVGTKKANAFGLYDMSGNAGEWVEDCWHEGYVGAPTDGSAWSNNCDNNGVAFVLRGGYWVDFASFTRSTDRHINRLDGRAAWYGFRLARTVAP